MTVSRRRTRVAHVITRLDLGGAQENTLYCVRHHDRRQFAVDLIAGRGGLLDGEARAIPDARVRLVPFLAHPISPLADIGALVRLWHLWRSEPVDIVHTHSSKAGIVGRLAAFAAGVPVVVHTIHGWSFNATQSPLVRSAYLALERLAALCTGRLVTVSAHDRDRGLRLGVGQPSQYAVLHSGIDVRSFRAPENEPAEVRLRLGIGPGEILVGTLACLKPQKAPLDFVRVAAAAHRQDARLRFAIAGDGEQRGEVERAIREAGLGGIVQILGWRRDVVDLLHAMDVFLLTSRFEGLPRAVLQAMAAGVPVVATAVDGTPEVIHDRRTGLLIPPGDPEAGARALLEILSDEALRRCCIREATRTLDASFEIDTMVKSLEEIYLSSLGEVRGRGPVHGRRGEQSSGDRDPVGLEVVRGPSGPRPLRGGL